MDDQKVQTPVSAIDTESDLANELAAAETQPVRFDDLPEVGADDFEELYSWFLS